jgi:hypothetical protein
MVDHELEVQIRYLSAGVAVTRSRLSDIPAAPAKSEVAALDRVEEHRPVDLLGCHEREGGIAFELGQPEVGPQRRDDCADNVCEDVLCVVQLDVGQVARVAEISAIRKQPSCAAESIVPCRSARSGTNIGPMGETPPTGARVDWPFVVVLDMQNRKAKSHRGYGDRVALMTQLGLMPGPAHG